jgi:chromosome segregation ATPase
VNGNQSKTVRSRMRKRDAVAAKVFLIIHKVEQNRRKQRTQAPHNTDRHNHALRTIRLQHLIMNHTIGNEGVAPVMNNNAPTTMLDEWKAETTDTINGLKDTINGLKDTINGLKVKIYDLDAKNGEITAELSDTKITIKSLQGELSDVKAELSDVKAELDNVKAELDNVNAQNVDIKAELSDMKAELGNVNAQNVEITAELSETKNELNAKVEDLTGKIEKLSKDNVNSSTAIKRMLQTNENEVAKNSTSSRKCMW